MEEKDEKKEINPMNGAGEYLYFTTDSIVELFFKKIKKIFIIFSNFCSHIFLQNLNKKIYPEINSFGILLYIVFFL